MKKKIGFIDHYIDEWHAQNYPRWIRGSSFGDRYDIALVWEEITPEGKMSLDAWCDEHKVAKASSIEQIVEESDCIVVLSPDNAERHEDLSDLPLRSGKPVYIDKPIAPSLAEAKRMYEKAAKFGTPLMSTSALRFAEPLVKTMSEIGDKKVNFVGTRGPGLFYNYSIHQFEPLVMLIGTGATRIMQIGNAYTPLLLIDYPDNRRATMNMIWNHPFQISAQLGGDPAREEASYISIDDLGDFFPPFIEGMLKFFDTKVSPIAPEQTLEIAALIEAGTAALKTPDTWVNLPH